MVIPYRWTSAPPGARKPTPNHQLAPPPAWPAERVLRRVCKVCKTHLGTRNVDYRMKRYVFRRTVDGIHIIHLGKTWEKPLGGSNRDCGAQTD